MSVKSATSTFKGPYEGPITVEFGNNSVKITTNRLVIRNIQANDLDNCISLFANNVVMERFWGGPRLPEDKASKYSAQALERGRLFCWPHRGR